ncbi:hypothetical protein [Streptomyces ziwulingensis]|uniref:Uncharacterized protein n=1 Tax=Streptomyces ziwulingensis TaxID=1045501 RepID=A0ABP9D4A2_9ACTN
MSDRGINVSAWRERLAAVQSQDVSAVLVVQCDQIWLQPEYTAFRNEIDQHLMTAHLRRGPHLAITRVVLHNLPIAPEAPARASAVDRAFEEWQHRLAASSVLLSELPSTHRVHRLILRSDEVTARMPDMVEILRDGEWTDSHRAGAVFHAVRTNGTTTPLTGYDVDLDGPFGDADPSVFM